MSNEPSIEEQKALRAALDAALDDLGEDASTDEEEDIEEEEEDNEEEEDVEQEHVEENPIVEEDETFAKSLDDNIEKQVEEVEAVYPDEVIKENASASTEEQGIPPPEPPATPIVLDSKLAAAEAVEKAATSQQSSHVESNGSICRTPPPSVASTPLDHTSTTTQTPSVASTIPFSNTTAPFMGPPRPPTSTSSSSKRKPHHTDPDKLFMEMMEDMLMTEQVGVTGTDEMMMRLVQQLQEQLHELEEEEAAEESEQEDERDEATEQHLVDEAQVVAQEKATTYSGYSTPFEFEPKQENQQQQVREEPPLPPTSTANVPVQAHESLSLTEKPQSTATAVVEPPSDDVPQSASETPQVASTSKQSSTKKSKSSSSSSSTIRTKQPPRSPAPSVDPQQDLDAAISQLIQGMAQQAALDDQDDDDMRGSSSNDVPNEADLLNLLMKQLQGSAESGATGDENGGSTADDDFNADAMIDGMMEQLLSKDLMYEPMKQVAMRFPKWLEERRNTLSEPELLQRQGQCECFQKLVHVYETQPGDTAQLMTLMQEVQEFGQPPAEIIHEIAPGLELDANGLPKLDGGSGAMPSSLGGDSDECRIM